MIGSGDFGCCRSHMITFPEAFPLLRRLADVLACHHDSFQAVPTQAFPILTGGISLDCASMPPASLTHSDAIPAYQSISRLRVSCFTGNFSFLQRWK